MDYKEQLKHPQWQKKRLQIMKRDKFKCKLCGDTETMLNIHHIEYGDGMAWEIENEKLITLCKHCHEEVEQLKSEDESIDFDFKRDKISKLSGWADGSRIMLTSLDGMFFVRIYSSKDSFICGYQFNYYKAIDFRKIINHAIKNG